MRGRTIQDLVMEYNPVSGDWHAPTVCLLNNQPVLRKDWPGAILEPAAEVYFIELPRGGGGGGSNPLQIILTVVVMVVALYAGAAVAGALVGTSSAAYGAVSTLVSGAILAAGGILMGAIFKPKAAPTGQSATPEQADPTYSVSGGNRARLFEVIGEGFGRMRVVPDQVARPWAYYIGNDQYYYQVLGLGQGSYDVESLAFGDTVFWRKGSGLVAGYEVELQFKEPGETVTLFPDNVDTSIEVAGQELFSPNNPEYAGWLGPFSANSPGTKTSRIVNNIVIPQGGGYYDDEGNLGAITITILIEYRSIDDDGKPLSDWQTLKQQSWTLRTLTPQRFSVDTPVPNGRYQCRARRLDYAVIENGSLSGRYMGRVAWESLFSFLPGTLNYNQSTVALRIKASNVLSQQAASSLSVVYTRKLPIYNPATKTWSAPQPTRKFAAVISHILRAEWGGKLPDRLIDLDSLWSVIDPILSAKGWTFDGYFSQAYTVWQLLLEVCQPFRVVPRIVNGLVSFVFDQAGRPVRHIFTPHDIIRGSLSVTYNTFSENTPDDIMWTYLDESVGFQSREVQCVLPDSESRAPAIKSPIGVVNRNQAHKMGLFQASINRKRRITAKFQCEAVGRLLLMGDVCALHHPYFSDLISGPLAWWDEDNLMLDIGVEIAPPDKEVYVSLSRPDGTPWGPCRVREVRGMELSLDAADYNLLLQQGQGNPFEWVDFGQGRLPTIWSLHSARAIERRMIITSVVPLDLWHYEINCMNDDPTVDEYENMPTPVWSYRGQDSDLFTPLAAPSGIQVSGIGSAQTPTLRVSWLPVAGAIGYRIEQAIEQTSWGLTEDTLINSIVLPVAPGAVRLRIAAKDAENRVGSWARWTGTTDFLYYPAPSLRGSYDSTDVLLSWSRPDTVPGDIVLAWDLFVLDPNGFTVLREIELPPEESSFLYTLDMAQADGNVHRISNFVLRYRTMQANLSDSGSITLLNDAPSLTNANYETSRESVTITSASITGENTGLVIARGLSANFLLADAAEFKEAPELPFTWGGLTGNTMYYFRMAAKDSFYDAVKDKESLLWSPVQTITTQE